MPRTPILRSLFALALCSIALAAQGQDPAAERDAARTLSRIAFGSCAKEDRPQPIWEQILAERPDAWIWAGDNIYGDTEDMNVMRAKYARLGAVPGWQALRETGIPVVATWDDHDYGVNDGGADYRARVESQEAFLDFFGVAKDSPRRRREGVYHAATYGPEGKRVQIIALDTRYHRSALSRFRSDDRRGAGYRPLDTRDATMLGAAQWAWLEARLREPAEVRIIVSSIQLVAAEHRYEKWANLPRERQRFVELLAKTEAKGVIVLSGDRHHAELSALDRKGDYPLYDLTASGINMSRAPRDGETQPPEINHARVGRVYRGPHFGLVTIDWTREDPLIELAIVDERSERPVRETFNLSKLSKQAVRAPRFEAPKRDRADAGATLTLDGQLDDWSGDRRLALQGDTLIGRFSAPEVRSLSSGPEATIVAFDLDGDPQTGARAASWTGADLTITWNERIPGERRPGWRPRVRFFDAAGNAIVAEPEAIGFSLAPTHASDRFEFALDRTAPQVSAALAASKGPVRYVAGFLGEGGSFRPLSSVEADLSRGDGVVARSAALVAPLPTAPEQGLRVLSWNVLWGKPGETPTPYARVIRALNPDVILIQEWDRRRTSEAELIAWFREHVHAETAWNTMVTGQGDFGQGTAVVSRWPILARAPAHLPVDGGGSDFPVRLAAAVVDAPAGRVLAASVHLKAAGSMGSEEDARRLAESRAINALLRGMAAVAEPDLIVLGGDFNLVGSPEVIAPALKHLDRDESPLVFAHAEHLGRPGITHTHGQSAPYSRLDYIAYSDAVADLRAAFVLDLSAFPAEWLKTQSLEASDTKVSDHLPLVIDIAPRLPRAR